MNKFKEYIYRISAIFGETPIACAEPIQFEGGRGVFIFDVTLGTEVGTVSLDYQAFGIPDRFTIEYDGVVVADSKYVGDSLTGNPPNYSGMVGSTYNNVPEYYFDGNQFIPSGVTQNITIQQSDVADFGSTAGTGTIQFQKNSTTPTVMTVKVFAPLGDTLWNLTTECPTTVAIGCAEPLSFSSDDQAGKYYTDVLVGSDAGLVTLNYDAGNIPDRFEILYNGILVADSKLVGGYLTGNPPDADTALWEGAPGSGNFVGKTYNGIPDYEWNGVDYTANGNTTNNTIQQSDVADFGDTAGAGQLSFVKPAGLPATMTIITSAFPANTGFSFTPACPATEPVNIQMSTLNSGSFNANTVTNGGATLRWNATNGVVYGKSADQPTFDLSSNIGTVDFYIFDTTNVTDFNVLSKQLTNIDVSGNVNLSTLNVGDNSLTSLDVSTNTGLTQLSCYINNLTTLDVSTNTALTALACYENNLTALNVDNNTGLLQLYCSDNSINSLNVNLNTALLDLDCGFNNISSLNVDNNTSLTSLNCNDNAISSLSVSLNTSLTTLNCKDNSIPTLDVSTNTGLTFLDCRNNSLVNLSITNNTALSILRCEGNVLAASDIDNIIIQLDNNGLSNGTLTIPVGRTAASDAAKVSLQGKGWTVTEL